MDEELNQKEMSGHDPSTTVMVCVWVGKGTVHTALGMEELVHTMLLEMYAHIKMYVI